MELSTWLPGIIIVLIGFSGWKFPKLINIFSKEDKETMNLKEVGNLYRNIFVTIGVLFIVTSYFLQKANMPLMSGIVLMVLILVGVFVFAAKAEKYKKKK